MTTKAILFGSIGAVAETSDIQRRAYNQSMSEHGLDWSWDRETYTELLEHSGGKDRLELLSRATNGKLTSDTITSIHARKTEIACAEVSELDAPLRPGIAELAQYAKDKGLKLGFVTTTYRPNVDAILDAAGSALSKSDLDVIIIRDDVEDGKPSPDAYEVALKRLGISADEAIAIEDTELSILSAKRAGVRVVATSGEFSAGQDTSRADLVLDKVGDTSGPDQRLLDLLA